MTQTSGGEAPAEHPEGDGCAASAGPASQLGAGSTASTGVECGASGPGSSDAARLARRRRLQALAGVTVLGSDGAQVGRVRDVYLHDATGELAAITVVRRQLSSRSVLIPTAAIAVLPAQHTEPDEPDPDRRAEAQVTAARHGGDSAGGDGAGRKGTGGDGSGREGVDQDEASYLGPDADGAAVQLPDTTSHGSRDDSEGAGRSDGADRRATVRRTADRQHRRAATDRDADPAHPQAMWLFVDAASARAGLRPPDTLHASPRTLREAARAVGLEDAAGAVDPEEASRAAGPEEAAAG